MIIPKIKILHSHGRQAIADLDAVELTSEFRGRPELTAPQGAAQIEAVGVATAMCPTQSITEKPLSLDMGRCMFCGECARIAPHNFNFTNDYRIGSATREGLIIKEDTKIVDFGKEHVRPQISRYFRQALKLRQVSAGGDNSVEMELNASGNVNFDFGRYGVEFTASPRHADGVVITGPVTRNMAEALEICYDAIADPKIIVACGSEACSGGLFAESRAIDRSFINDHHIDLWLPGAPTHPMTFIDGIMNILGRKERK